MKPKLIQEIDKIGVLNGDGEVKEKANKDEFMSHKDKKGTNDVHGLLTDGKIIEESGSNLNGEYVKFSDGTMICTHRVSLSDTDTEYTWTFASLFTSRDYSSGTIVRASSVSQSHDVFDATSGSLRQSQARFFITSDSLTSRGLQMLAIGRWK